ncbi:TniQ family protein [Paenibacillus eucommiae]|uniref:TniQ domain-containing protein n=1 Tax=Paenibacillus eucommiae TaxID=1355755 RepID=A0ABS4IUD1_9BACL|nr:TniQ family protein [Paenibacillus eucommiae]MBP1991192.1 hypothetical protein [Paenibacillus eucommiae]
MSVICWNNEWTQPYESMWSILNKLMASNRIEARDAFFKLCRDNLKGKQMIGLSNRSLLLLGGLDANVITKSFGYDLIKENQQYMMNIMSWLPEGHRNNYFDNNLRWCNDCLRDGFHSLLHQFKLINYCPIHEKLLQSICINCEKQLQFAFLLEKKKNCECNLQHMNLNRDITCWKFTDYHLNLLPWLGVKNIDKINYFINFETARDLKDILSCILISLGCEADLKDNYHLNFSKMAPYIHNLKLKKEQCNDLVDQAKILYGGDDNFILCDDLYESVRQTFKAIDKNLRKRILSTHRSCITKFISLSKSEGEDIPEICPYAYAYVFWKHSLFKSDRVFTERTIGAYSKQNIKVLQFPIKLIEDRLLDLVLSYISEFKVINVNQIAGIRWLIMKYSSELLIGHFTKWMYFAKQYSTQHRTPNNIEMDQAPKVEPLIIIPYSKLFKFYSWRNKNDDIHWKNINLKCPYASTKTKRKNSTEISQHPLSLALNNDDSKISNFMMNYINRFRVR